VSVQDVIEVATGFSYCEIPPGSVNRSAWQVTVEFRGVDDATGAYLYTVKHLSECLRRDGTWEYEPLPSNRSDKFQARTRFPLAEAQKLAFVACQTVKVNGRTAADVVAWEKQVSR
jgi:hypothetical protein